MTAAQFPDAFEFLFAPARYKGAYGGRGAAKSWAFARALLIEGTQTKLLIVCARETQKSIADSVHRLLSDQIVDLGLQAFYHVEQAKIYGANGTEFIFAGLRHNIDNIKSLEGADRVWVEEAQSVSRGSWEKLVPTVRKNGSEIWVSFNPDLETDDTFQRFVVKPPDGSQIHKVSWRDNPWFPIVLRDEMEHLRKTDPDAYDHVWEGNCRRMLEGAIYANELRQAEAAGQITQVPYDRIRPVDCYWDLGYGDATAIWMVQAMPFQYRVVDYLESSAKTIEWYIKELQQRGYIFGTHWLPWDIGTHAKLLGRGKSVEEMMRIAGMKVRISMKMPMVHGINAARTIFPLCYFDRQRCADGLQALRHYRWGETAAGIVTREPLHDWASHGADAWRYFAMAAKTPELELKTRQTRQEESYSQWS